MKRFGKILSGVLLAGTFLCTAACGGKPATPSDGENPGGITQPGDGVVELTEGMFKKDLYYEDLAAISVDKNHSYPRVVEADDGTLIMTAEDLKYTTGIPIYRSTDGGKSFVMNAQRVRDPEYAKLKYDAKWQPTLYVLPQDVGETLKKGDILLIATSIDNGADDFNRNEIHLYISKDVGVTWNHLSKMHESKNMANSDGVENGCWEGNLYVNGNGQLTCMFADETDHKNHAQRIVYKTTTDGVNWSNLVEVVALNERDLRPGMPVVTKVKDGKYFLTIEMVGENNVPIYWKTSDDGIDWGDVTNKGQKVQCREKVMDDLYNREVEATVYPGSSPYCVWTPYGKDANGTVFVTAQRTHYEGAVLADAPGNDLFISYDLGQTWERINHPATYNNATNKNRPAYSPSMSISQDGKSMYVVNTVITEEGSQNNRVVYAKVNLGKSLKAL